MNYWFCRKISGKFNVGQQNIYVLTIFLNYVTILELALSEWTKESPLIFYLLHSIMMLPSILLFSWTDSNRHVDWRRSVLQDGESKKATISSISVNLRIDERSIFCEENSSFGQIRPTQMTRFYADSSHRSAKTTSN